MQAQPFALTEPATPPGSSLGVFFVGDDAVSPDLASSPLFGVFASSLLTLLVVPVL